MFSIRKPGGKSQACWDPVLDPDVKVGPDFRDLDPLMMKMEEKKEKGDKKVEEREEKGRERRMKIKMMIMIKEKNYYTGEEGEGR